MRGRLSLGGWRKPLAGVMAIGMVGLVEVDKANRITYRWDDHDLSPHENVRTVMTVYERRAAR